ncbi:hypothetical protein B0H14DRAFT_3513857 [Mycena olivaceomarginata]|nr:hypothetical protein B0H14DRAFT_3513857 [Mycena olivaceomarginata]
MSHTLNLISRSPDTQILTRVIVGLIAPGFGLTVVLLALFKYAAWNPVSRRYVDCVSLRLLTYALIAHLVFCVTFPMSSLNVHPGWQCDLLAFGMNLSLMFSAGVFFCIALNLLLVLALRVNGQKMEKYYVFGITFTCLIVNLASYASGSLGHQMGRGQRDMLIFWIVLFAVGEVVAFLVIGYVVSYMFKTRFKDSDVSQYHPTPLYPIVSCALNISTVMIDLYESRNYTRKHLMSTELSWRLNLAVVHPRITCAAPPEDESTTQLHDLGRSALCLSTVIDIPPETYCEADKLMRETSTIPTLDKTLEEGNERRLDKGQDQSGMMMNAPGPTQRPSIDVVCHI